MDNVSVMMWGMLFGAVGFGFFVYGKKQGAVVPLVTGLTLCVVPYFITNLYLLLGVGTVLVVVPYFVRA